MAHQQSSPAVRVIVAGKCGVGKSSLCNLLGGVKKFRVGSGFVSETQTCQKIVTPRGDIDMMVVDTPGTIDTKLKAKEIRREISRAVAGTPEGFSAILLLLRADMRLTEEEKNAIKEAETTFGLLMYKYTIVVFTRADQCSNPDTFVGDNRRQSAFLDQILKACDDRYVVIDARDDVPSEVQKHQLNQLLARIRSLPYTNNPSHYTNELFALAERVWQEDESKRDAEKDKQIREIKEEVDRVAAKVEDLMEKKKQCTVL